MTEVEISLRAQLDGALKKILSLTTEIEDLKTRQKERDDQTALRAAFEVKKNLTTTFSGLEKSLAETEDPGIRAETVGFNNAIKLCVSLMNQS